MEDSIARCAHGFDYEAAPRSRALPPFSCGWASGICWRVWSSRGWAWIDPLARRACAVRWGGEWRAPLGRLARAVYRSTIRVSQPDLASLGGTGRRWGFKEAGRGTVWSTTWATQGSNVYETVVLIVPADLNALAFALVVRVGLLRDGHLLGFREVMLVVARPSAHLVGSALHGVCTQVDVLSLAFEAAGAPSSHPL